MMRRVLSWTLLVLLFLSLAPGRQMAYAAKKRVRKAGAPVARGVSYSSAKLSRGTHSVVLTLMNLGSVKRIDYALSYTANGIAQGAMGGITPGGQTTDTRDLYFGTCSHGVCTPHYGIAGATVLVTTTLTNNATHTKRYRLKGI